MASGCNSYTLFKESATLRRTPRSKLRRATFLSPYYITDIMYHPEYGKALSALRDIHRQYQKTIKPSLQDVRLAMYYLTGGCITQAHFALRAWTHGDLNTIYRVKRFIDEVHLLTICLIAVKDRERFVRRFFEDEIVTINPNSYKKEILSATGMDEITFKDWVETHKKISHGFSKGVHPNLRSVAYNSNLDTGEFDYDAAAFAYYEIDGFDFANFVIIPTIDCVRTPAAAFGLSEKDFEYISTVREKIQQIAIELRAKRRSKNH